MPLIDDERAVKVRTSIIAVAHEYKALIHAVGVMPDHIHVAVSIPPSVTVSNVVQGMKGRSSFLINRSRSTGQDDFGWQREFGIVSFSERSLPDVVAYVENQRQHHAEGTIRSYLERASDPKQAPLNAP
jgi:putative transposase